MEVHFCWRCKAEVPFLTEVEWAEIDPLISLQAKIIKDYRVEHSCDIQTAIEYAFKPATEKYLELTGFVETNYVAILHHRLSLLGKNANIVVIFCVHQRQRFVLIVVKPQ